MSSNHQQGFTLPELVAVMVIVAVAAAAIIAIPALGRERSRHLEAASTVDAVLSAVTAAWATAAQMPDDHTSLVAHYPAVTYLPGETPVAETSPVDTVSVALVGTDSGAAGVAARAVGGACLLARLDIGEGARPARYAVVPAGGTTPCSGRVAVELAAWTDVGDPAGTGVGADPGTRDGGSWGSPLRLP